MKQLGKATPLIFLIHKIDFAVHKVKLLLECFKRRLTTTGKELKFRKKH